MGPTLPISKELHQQKYRLDGESFQEAMERIAKTLADNPSHYKKLLDILLEMRFLPAGRIQNAIGSPRKVTALNCYVSRTIEDSYEGIMQALLEGGRTMRMGGGVGYDFSSLRGRGTPISSLGSHASGPVSFMHIFSANCLAICSAGHRRGAQMSCLRVDHPDVEEFIEAKNNSHMLTGFNISVTCTDEFMNAVKNDLIFDLRWGGKVYKTVKARYLWDKIMRSTWDYAEPGVIFIDHVNAMNNLYYHHQIAASNPCSEQMLPPYGACLLGSFNLVKYLYWQDGSYHFNFSKFREDIYVVHPAMDNVIDNTIYPLPEQESMHKSDRRMGLGITGLANTIEALGHPYASPEFLKVTKEILITLKEEAYASSVERAQHKGAFPSFNREKYIRSNFIQEALPVELRRDIWRYGVRNSHLTSIAPTGTISLCADNVSSGIEPVFATIYNRDIFTLQGKITETVKDYGVRVLGTMPKIAEKCTVDEHLSILLVAQPHIDSAISKTCNVGPDVTFEEFENIYMKAWEGGAKSVSTFRRAGKRQGIISTLKEEASKACRVDEHGRKTCE